MNKEVNRPRGKKPHTSCGTGGKNSSNRKGKFQNGMEYVFWAKGPALGPVRSVSADRKKVRKF